MITDGFIKKDQSVLQLDAWKSVRNTKSTGSRVRPAHGSQQRLRDNTVFAFQTTYNKLLSAYIRGLFSCWLAGCEVTERLGLQSASLANPYFVILPFVRSRFSSNRLLSGSVARQLPPTRCLCQRSPAPNAARHRSH